MYQALLPINRGTVLGKPFVDFISTSYSCGVRNNEAFHFESDFI